jgi:hypothetical protein
MNLAHQPRAPQRPDRKTWAERWGWLFRHYGVRRLALILIGGPIFYLTRFLLAWWSGPIDEQARPAVTCLLAASHDLWFGWWIATAATPLLWIVSYYASRLDFRWGFRAIAFVWWFDGTIAAINGALMLWGAEYSLTGRVLRPVVFAGVLPATIAIAPWLVVATWERIGMLPCVTRLRYSGRGQHADWIPAHLLHKHTKPLNGASSWRDLVG